MKKLLLIIVEVIYMVVGFSAAIFGIIDFLKRGKRSRFNNGKREDE